jgi:hypothetical protein
MAKVDIGKEAAVVVDQARVPVLKALSVVRPDNDLPAADRRDRAKISDTTTLAEGQAITIKNTNEQVTVLGPGRGKGWVLVAWLEDREGTPFECIGTIHESQIAP